MVSEATNIVAPEALNQMGGFVMVPGSPLHLIDTCKQAMERHEFSQAKKLLKEVLAKPEINEALLQREHNDRVIQIHQQEIEARQVVKAVLEQFRAKEIATQGEDSPMVQALDQQIEQTQANMDGLQAAADMLSDQITEINSRPEILALRPLEAKADLGAEVLKRRGDFAVDVAKSGRLGVNQIASAAQAVAEVINTVDLANQVVNLAAGTATTVSALSSAAPILTGGAQVLTGSAQAVVSAASLANNAYHACKDLQRNATAKAVKEGVQNDPELRAAIQRIENKAQRNAIERAVKTTRDGALVVTGVATVVAGSALVTSGVLAAASAPGFGAASAPTLALTGAATGVAVGAGVVSVAATAGTYAFQAGRHQQSAAAKEVCIQAAVGTEALLLKTEDGQVVGGKLPSENGQPQKLKDPNIPKNVADAMHTLQKHAIKKGDLSLNDALDVAKLNEYAKTRLVSLDTREAVAVFSAKLTEECQQAFDKRGGANIVSSDLPVGTPAVEAARGLGMTDREITSLVNTFNDALTNQMGLEALAQKTGLRHGSDTTLEPALEQVKNAGGFFKAMKQKLGFGGDKHDGDAKEDLKASNHGVSEEDFEEGMDSSNDLSFDEAEYEAHGNIINLDEKNVRAMLCNGSKTPALDGPLVKAAEPGHAAGQKKHTGDDAHIPHGKNTGNPKPASPGLSASH